MKAVSTVIVPFYFRERIENKTNFVFSKQVEPTPVTLFRHWSTRKYSNLYDSIPTPSQEIIDYIDQDPKLSNWKERYLNLARSTRDPRSPRAADFTKIEKELSELIDKSTNKSKIFDYRDYIKATESLSWQSLWPQIESIDFGITRSELSLKAAQKIILNTKEIIKKKHKEESAKNKNKIKIDNYRGLDASNIVQESLSSSMKHMWSLDDDESKDPSMNQSDSSGLNLISGRSLLLSLPLHVIKSIFGTTKFKINKSEHELNGYIEITRILITLMPNQNGYCCFTFNILPQSQVFKEFIAELQESIYSLIRLGNEFKLTAYEPDEEIIHHPLYQERAALLLSDALREGQFTLRDLTHWLIALNNKEAQIHSIDLNRCGHRRKYVHHTSIHLTKQELPECEDWHKVLCQEVWNASRGVGMKRSVPSLIDQDAGNGEFFPYSNLIIGCAREGSCALSWDEPARNPHYEPFGIASWSETNYHGVYLLFYLHVLGEEAMLEDLSYQALEIIKKNISLSSNINRKNYLERLKIRDELKQLIYEMVYLNLSFSSANIGGSSDYMRYILKIKSAYSIDALRDELRGNISELSDIVEQIDQEQQQGFDNRLTILGAIVLPFGLLSGLMGMNNFMLSDEALKALTPNYLNNISFTTIILACLTISLLSLFLMAREKIEIRWREVKSTKSLSRKNRGQLITPTEFIQRSK